MPIRTASLDLSHMYTFTHYIYLIYMYHNYKTNVLTTYVDKITHYIYRIFYTFYHVNAIYYLISIPRLIIITV